MKWMKRDNSEDLDGGSGYAGLIGHTGVVGGGED